MHKRPLHVRAMPLVRRGCIALLAVLLGMSGAVASEPVPPLSIAICDDESEWPPYSYFARVNGKKSKRLSGYSVDVINEIFTSQGVVYHIDMIPWTRCLAVAAMGKKYQMLLGLSINTTRAANFLFSRPYYTTSPYYYYSRSKHPDGLRIAGPADLKNYRICGVRGYNYTAYGLGPGEVDDGARDFTAMVAKLRMGRCALFLEQDEVMAGFAVLGTDYLADPDIGKAPMPGMRRGLFHFGISRQFAHAAALKKLLDDSLLSMEQSGRLVEIWNKAVPKRLQVLPQPATN